MRLQNFESLLFGFARALGVFAACAASSHGCRQIQRRDLWFQGPSFYSSSKMHSGGVSTRPPTAAAEILGEAVGLPGSRAVELESDHCRSFGQRMWWLQVDVGDPEIECQIPSRTVDPTPRACSGFQKVSSPSAADK